MVESRTTAERACAVTFSAHPGVRQSRARKRSDSRFVGTADEIVASHQVSGPVSAEWLTIMRGRCPSRLLETELRVGIANGYQRGAPFTGTSPRRTVDAGWRPWRQITTGVRTGRVRAAAGPGRQCHCKKVGSSEPAWAATLVAGTALRPPDSPSHPKQACAGRSHRIARATAAPRRSDRVPASTGEQADNETSCCAGTASAVRVWALASPLRLDDAGHDEDRPHLTTSTT